MSNGVLGSHSGSKLTARGESTKGSLAPRVGAVICVVQRVQQCDLVGANSKEGELGQEGGAAGLGAGCQIRHVKAHVHLLPMQINICMEALHRHPPVSGCVKTQIT